MREGREERSFLIDFGDFGNEVGINFILIKFVLRWWLLEWFVLECVF